MAFSDLAPLLTIAERLHSGRAALLVGAGMSRNARPVTPDAPVFADWQGLAKAMQEALRSQSGAGNVATRGTLRLAEEYESAFGRSALIQLVARHVPDKLYEPGDLHVQLMNLPWVDVFTTNYDTLLERAGRKSERYYGLVQAPEDLPRRSAPRVVKLHGSLPSQLPLTLTEEDYRKYPQRFAPFVHLVQTSLMEHAFVLVGFSGDDPNFLAWRGWLQDQLGPHAPPIYLCGTLDLSPSRRRLLEKQGARPVDLGPLFSEKKWPLASKRHEASLEWLLTALEAEAPPEPTDWPGAKQKGSSALPKGYPPLPQELVRHANSAPSKPLKQGSLTPVEQSEGKHKEGLRDLVGRWRRERQDYPGWVVAPQKNRNWVWGSGKASTRWWAHECWRGSAEEIDGLEAPYDLAFLYELVWRQEQALVPMLGEQVQFVSGALSRYNPAPHRVGFEADHYPGATGCATFNWSYLTEAWVQLGLALLGHAREVLDEGLFELWEERLAPLASDESSSLVRFYYERALFHLTNLDPEGALRALDEWPASTRDGFPFGETYRAYVLAEAGQTSEAERTVRGGLERILEAQSATAEPNIALLSQEGWTRRLMGIIQGSLKPLKRAEERLREHDCYPSDAIGSFIADLDKGVPDPVLPYTVREEFDPGRSSTTHHLVPGYNYDKHRSGPAYLRALVKGGQPLRVNDRAFRPGNALRATDLMRPFKPKAALATTLRVACRSSNAKGNQDTEAFFTRARVSGFSGEDVRELYELLLHGVRAGCALTKDSSQFEGAIRNGVTRAVSVWIDVLSRLAIRLPSDEVEVIIKEAISYGELSQVKANLELHVPLGDTLRRLLRYASDEVLARVAPDVLTMPMPDDKGVDARTKQWPNAGSILRSLKGDRPLRISQSYVSRLIESVSGKDALARSHAVSRLRYIYANRGMGEEDEARFAASLWSQRDSDSGLPEVQFSLPTLALRCPEPEPGMAEQAVRSHLLGRKVPENVSVGEDDGTVTVKHSQNGLNHIIAIWRVAPPRHHHDSGEDAEESATTGAEAYIRWSEEDAAELLKRVVSWWDHEKTGLESGSGGEGLRCIPGVLRKAILPPLTRGNVVVQEARRVLDEMEDSGFGMASALPELVRLGEVAESEAARRIRRALASLDKEIAEEGARAVSEWAWLDRASDAEIPTLPDDLLTYLIYTATTHSGSAETLKQVSSVIEDAPGILLGVHEQRLYDALEYLLKSTAPPSREAVWHRPSLDESEDAPARRAAAASLARVLYDGCRNGSEASDEYEAGIVLEKWREVALCSPLPEVRAAWKPCGHDYRE